jgi:uncharacterized protein (DUF1501 family)
LTVTKLSEFTIPDDPIATYHDLAAKKAALQAAYASEATDTSGLQMSVGISGDAIFGKMDDYAAVPVNWSSNLNPFTFNLARRLKQIASVIRWDYTMSPASPTGARFFHVRHGGFDTHTQQGSVSGRQALLLQRLSQAIKAFYDDMVSLGVASKVLILTFSEFGRRIAENGSAGTAGTDHGAAAPLFVVGQPVVGGIYGRVPDLSDPNNGNLKFHTDFRKVYATVIDKWLASAGAHAPILGVSYTPAELLGFLP